MFDCSANSQRPTGVRKLSNRGYYSTISVIAKRVAQEKHQEWRPNPTGHSRPYLRLLLEESWYAFPEFTGRRYTYQVEPNSSSKPFHFICRDHRYSAFLCGVMPPNRRGSGALKRRLHPACSIRPVSEIRGRTFQPSHRQARPLQPKRYGAKRRSRSCHQPGMQLQGV